jgi:hypothetical protein
LQGDALKSENPDESAPFCLPAKVVVVRVSWICSFQDLPSDIVRPHLPFLQARERVELKLCEAPISNGFTTSFSHFSSLYFKSIKLQMPLNAYDLE